MRHLLVLLALTGSAAADPTCDPDAALGDRGPLVDHYTCQVSQNGKASDAPAPCEIIDAGNHTGYLRPAKLNLTCSVTGTVDAKSGFEGDLYCSAIGPYVDGMASYKSKLRPIAGGFVIEATTDIIHLRQVSEHPFKTVSETEKHVAVAMTVCRKPWPRGFKNEIEELEKHPPK